MSDWHLVLSVSQHNGERQTKALCTLSTPQMLKPCFILASDHEASTSVVAIVVDVAK